MAALVSNHSSHCVFDAHELFHILTTDADQGGIGIVKTANNETACNVTSSGRMCRRARILKKTRFGHCRYMNIKRKSVIESNTEEFDMIRNSNNGSGYNNS